MKADDQTNNRSANCLKSRENKRSDDNENRQSSSQSIKRSLNSDGDSNVEEEGNAS